MSEEGSSTALKYAALTAEGALRELSSNAARGLTDDEVAERLKKYGHNMLESGAVRWWHILGRQFKSPFIYLLLGAAAIALALGERVDAALIAAFIIINTSLGFYHEFRSDRSLKLLKSFLTAHTTVLRGGSLKEIDVRDLVPGDILKLQSGDIVPADCRIIESEGLIADESVLTGESVSVAKSVQALEHATDKIYEAVDVLFSDTTIVGGNATAVVVATGKATEIGAVAQLTAETLRESDFEKGIGKFSAFILRLVGITLIFIFLANIFIKGVEAGIAELLVFSIALAVAVIPEALPVVSIFSLSHGAIELAKKSVVVKRLSAIEDLGGIDILCADKTGTITENKLKVADVLRVDAAHSLLGLGRLASAMIHSGEHGNPFDDAIKDAVTEKDLQAVAGFEPLQEAPFDPVRRINSVLARRGNEYIMVVRGAPEEVLACCRGVQAGDYAEWIARQGNDGRRILAIAARSMPGPSDKGLHECEKDMILVGFVAFEDPIKGTTKAAIEKARRLGVAVKIVTGDAPEVAGAVARQIGLLPESGRVITGSEFVALSEDERHVAAEKYDVFARVLPEQKYFIVSTLQERHSVGFLGEGINDAPALKAASVSLVVQGGSDIAREASDIILLNKSLSVIIDGIFEGRRVFANTLKYIRATLSSNFGNFYAVAIGSLFINFLPMLPVQILLLNLLSDFPIIGIATDTVSHEDVARPQRYSMRDMALIATLLGIVSTVFDFIFFALYVRISPAVLQTNWFIASVLTELVFLFSIRTRGFFLAARRPSGTVLWLTLFAAVVTVMLPFTGIGREVFHFTRPSPAHIMEILLLTALYFAVTETVKIFYYRFLHNRRPVV